MVKKSISIAGRAAAMVDIADACSNDATQPTSTRNRSASPPAAARMFRRAAGKMNISRTGLFRHTLCDTG
jgi:hypothetical protein